MTGQNIENLARVSSEALLEATGKTWDDWIGYLDKNRADSLSHKELVALLAQTVDKQWWCQKIAKGYEQYMLGAVTGQTAGGFQVGVRKTFPVTLEKAWDFVTSGKAMEIWLGKTEDLPLKTSKEYITGDEIRGEIKVMKALSHIRLTWQPKEWKTPSTLQIRVIANGAKTTISFHQERLPSEKERKKMKEKWSGVLDKMAELLQMAKQ